jgi:hypothetical protein
VGGTGALGDGAGAGAGAGTDNSTAAFWSAASKATKGSVSAIRRLEIRRGAAKQRGQHVRQHDEFGSRYLT